MDKKEALDALRIDRDAEPTSNGHGGRIASMLVALVVLIGGGVTAWAFLAPHALAVETAPVEVTGGGTAGNAGSVLNASGYVVAEMETTVSSQVTGMIEKVLVTEGMKVDKGQVLAYLDDAQARAQVANAESALRASQAAVAKAKAVLAQDRLTLERTQKMAAQHLTSRASLDQAKSTVNIDQAALKQAEAQVAVAEASLRTAQIRLGFTVIRAPFKGVVTEKYAHPGEMISPAAVGGFTKTGVCQLVDMDSLEIDVDVNEAYIQRVNEGLRVEAVLDAYPDWRIPAHVISVVPTANRQKATVKVRIAFDQLDPRIVPEMGVQVWFYEKAAPKAEHKPVALLVPAKAVHGGGADRYVFLVADGRAERQAVTVGPEQNGKVTVLSGLSGGQRVIVSAPQPLKGGERVEAKTI
ncbi:MAG TPA: efflux RND transporter periplasmic adaptor subunit [Gammaproteobacteria bacterium]|nr:efflux RND transporter periplasmic adaptor subunit [Gammaproteobacteria bacterium]